MIDVAIVGCGSIARQHLEAYLSFPERCRIVGFASRTKEKALALAGAYGLDIPIFESHQQLSESLQPKLVSLCTPPFTHADISIDLMRGGSDVLCEKPMATSLAECDRMIEVEQAEGRALSIVFQNRFRDQHMRLKSLLDSGRAGKVLHAQVDSLWWRGQAYYDPWWRGTWEQEGGGCTLNHAIHHIDLLLWMRGLPSEIVAFAANLNHPNSRVEDISLCTARYPDASLATVTSSLLHHGSDQQISFQTEKGKIGAPWRPTASKQNERGFPEADPDVLAELQEVYESIPALPSEAFQEQIDRALLRSEGRPAPDLARSIDGRNALEFICAAYKSAFERRIVDLPLLPEDPYYHVEGLHQGAQALPMWIP